MTATALRTWKLRCTELGRPPTMNAYRVLDRHRRAAVDRQWRTAGYVLAVEAHVPMLRRAHVVVLPIVANRRSMPDVGACMPAVKASIDGIIDAGVLPGDDPAHLTALTFLQPYVEGVDGLVVEIVEEA